MTNLDAYWDAFPSELKDRMNRWGFHTDGGNVSMKHNTYRFVKKLGRAVNNNVPMKDRDAFVKQYISKSSADFWGKYRKSSQRNYRWR